MFGDDWSDPLASSEESYHSGDTESLEAPLAQQITHAAVLQSDIEAAANAAAATAASFVVGAAANAAMTASAAMANVSGLTSDVKLMSDDTFSS